jgi:hypothetical protein
MSAGLIVMCREELLVATLASMDPDSRKTGGGSLVVDPLRRSVNDSHRVQDPTALYQQIGRTAAFQSFDPDYMSKSGDVVMSLLLTHMALWHDAEEYGAGPVDVLRPFALWFGDAGTHTLVEQFCTLLPGSLLEKEGFNGDCSRLLLTNVASGYRPGGQTAAWQIARLPPCLLIAVTGPGVILRLPRRLDVSFEAGSVSYELDCLVRSTAELGMHYTVVIVDGDTLIEIDNERVQDGRSAIAGFDPLSVQARTRLLAFRLVRDADAGRVGHTQNREAVHIPLTDGAGGAAWDISSLARTRGKWHKRKTSAVIHQEHVERQAPLQVFAPRSSDSDWPQEDDAVLREFVARFGLTRELIGVNPFLSVGRDRDLSELTARYELLAADLAVGPWTPEEDAVLEECGTDWARAGVATGRGERACIDRIGELEEGRAMPSILLTPRAEPRTTVEENGDLVVWCRRVPWDRHGLLPLCPRRREPMRAMAFDE